MNLDWESILQSVRPETAQEVYNIADKHILKARKEEETSEQGCKMDCENCDEMKKDSEFCLMIKISYEKIKKDEELNKLLDGVTIEEKMEK